MMILLRVMRGGVRPESRTAENTLCAGQFGLSIEQRKRLTIAVELVANPSIVFMDEPTSGLDARAAAIVMRTVRNTVDTGRTVVCTHPPAVHRHIRGARQEQLDQNTFSHLSLANCARRSLLLICVVPSRLRHDTALTLGASVMQTFDELLLMKRGGRIIFFGETGYRSQKLVDYFEVICFVWMLCFNLLSSLDSEHVVGNARAAGEVMFCHGGACKWHADV